MHMNDHLNKFLAKDLSQFIILMTNVFNSIQDLTIFQANPAFEDMFGWKKEEINQIDVSGIYLDYQLKQVEEILTRLRENKEILHFETQRKCKDGSIIDVLATYRPINKGNMLAVATYKDVTEEKRVMLKLKESEERYRKVVESSPDALGYPIGNVIGKSFLHHIHSEDVKK